MTDWWLQITQATFLSPPPKDAWCMVKPQHLSKPLASGSISWYLSNATLPTRGSSGPNLALASVLKTGTACSSEAPCAFSGPWEKVSVVCSVDFSNQISILPLSRTLFANNILSLFSIREGSDRSTAPFEILSGPFTPKEGAAYFWSLSSSWKRPRQVEFTFSEAEKLRSERRNWKYVWGNQLSQTVCSD
jgi:hypothetical protein